MNRGVWIAASVLLTALLSACSIGKPPPLAAQFDLGPLPKVRAAAPAPALQLLELSAPIWLATPGIAYRLDYVDPYRREVYRDSRWAAPPSALLGERLRQHFADAASAVTPAVVLRLELEAFDQRFSAATRSTVVLRVRARLGEPVARQQVFEIEKASPSADAAGAVQALAAASDELAAQLLAWARP